MRFHHIKGGLIPLGIALVAFPFVILFYEIIPSWGSFFSIVFQHGFSDACQTYGLFLVLLICSACVTSSLVFVLVVILLVLFVRQSRLFPNLLLALLMYNFLIELAYILVTRKPLLSFSSMAFLIIGGAIAAVVAPYILMSKRVKASFIR